MIPDVLPIAKSVALHFFTASENSCSGNKYIMMKKIFFITLICFSAFIKNTNAQATGVPDTLAYLQTIVANKAQYIGQPFSVLLNNLQIQIKYFSPFASIHHNKSKETSTFFSFYFPLSVADHYLSYPRLEIYWQPYLNAIQSNILFDNNNGGWVPTVVSYYTTGIIADIQILE